MINSDYAASYRDHQKLRLDPQVSKSRSLSGGGVIHRLDKGVGPVDATDVKTQKHSARQNRRPYQGTSPSTQELLLRDAEIPTGMKDRHRQFAAVTQ